MNRDLVQVAAEDLSSLIAEWGATISVPALRRASTTLRGLLIFGVYSRAWREVGYEKQPTVTAPDLDQTLAALPPGQMPVFGFGGGGTINGGRLLNLVTVETEGRIKQLPDMNFDRTYSLDQYLDSCGVAIGPTRIKRRHIISYVANKLGGAHLDFKREKVGGKAAYALLDKHAHRLMVEDKNAVYFELLSIGQLIGRSPDAAKFIERANAV